MFLSGTVFSQKASREDAVKVSMVSIVKDTSVNTTRALSFKLVIANKSIKNITLAVVDQADQALKEMGTYDLQIHPQKFYYLENKQHEKKTLFNSECFFIEPLAGELAKNEKLRIKLSYKLRDDSVKTEYYSISK